MVKPKHFKSKFAKRYPKEFQRQMVELHRAGNTLKDLSRRFGPSQWAISRWVKQADRDEGHGDGGLTSTEREELARLRRENRQLRVNAEVKMDHP
jgi:transposase